MYVLSGYQKDFTQRFDSAPSDDITAINEIMVTPGDDPLSAALAAAAELARNGGGILFPTAGLANAGAPIDPSKTILMTAALAGLSNFPIRIPPSSPFLRGTASYDDDDDDEDDEDDADDEDEDAHSGHDRNDEDEGRRVARSRERNREHARRTRIRKKAQLEALQSKVKGLQAESKVLKQSLEECSIASILVGLSSGERDATIQSLLKEATEIEGKDIFKIVGGKRKRFVLEPCGRTSQPLKVNINGQTTLIGGGRTHINWKSGVYSDENGVQRQLMHGQLESLR
jgi:bZIP transcription factor